MISHVKFLKYVDEAGGFGITDDKSGEDTLQGCSHEQI